MLPETQPDRRLSAAWRRLLRDEEGIALVLAMLTMLVLTISLTGVVFLTAAGARDAHRTNAGQKAYGLAESGINNALAVLVENYERGTVGPFPGISTLLPARQTVYGSGSCTAPVDNCVTWSGTLAGPLVSTPTAPWKYEWRLTATGSAAESDRAGNRGGQPHGHRHRPGRDSRDVAGERHRAAELPLLRRGHVVRELGARQGAAVRDARPAPGDRPPSSTEPRRRRRSAATST